MVTLFGVENPGEQILAYLKKDTDDKYYIDYFPLNIARFSNRINVQNYLENLRAIIIKGFKSSKPDLKVKYGWMKNKYNRLLRQLQRTENIYDISKEKGLQKYIDNLSNLK